MFPTSIPFFAAQGGHGTTGTGPSRWSRGDPGAGAARGTPSPHRHGGAGHLGGFLEGRGGQVMSRFFLKWPYRLFMIICDL